MKRLSSGPTWVVAFTALGSLTGACVSKPFSPLPGGPVGTLVFSLSAYLAAVCLLDRRPKATDRGA